MRFLTCFAVVSMSLLSGAADAWGPIGHYAVGRIAESHLSPRAEREIQALLGHETLPIVGIWSDQIRSDPAYDHTHVWHYTSVEDDETYATSTKNPDGDIIEAIERMSATLADPEQPEKERREALKWLVHLVADIHQPLHVGRKDDRGGNEIDVVWFQEEKNLHWVWDNGLIQQRDLSFSELAEYLLLQASHEDIDAWQSVGMREWARESHALRPGIYDIGDGDISWDYLEAHWATVEKRILQAGIRLAGLLNELLGTPPKAPASDW